MIYVFLSILVLIVFVLIIQFLKTNSDKKEAVHVEKMIKTAKQNNEILSNNFEIALSNIDKLKDNGVFKEDQDAVNYFNQLKLTLSVLKEKQGMLENMPQLRNILDKLNKTNELYNKIDHAKYKSVKENTLEHEEVLKKLRDDGHLLPKLQDIYETSTYSHGDEIKAKLEDTERKLNRMHDMKHIATNTDEYSKYINQYNAVDKQKTKEMIEQHDIQFGNSKDSYFILLDKVLKKHNNFESIKKVLDESNAGDVNIEDASVINTHLESLTKRHDEYSKILENTNIPLESKIIEIAKSESKLERMRKNNVFDKHESLKGSIYGNKLKLKDRLCVDGLCLGGSHLNIVGKMCN